MDRAEVICAETITYPPMSQSGDQVVVRKIRKFVITTITRTGEVLAVSLYKS